MALAAPSPSSSRAASAPNLVPSRAGCRVSITGARRASGFAVSSPMRRRQIRAKASPAAASAAASALLDLDLSATLSTHSAAAAAASAFGDLAEGLEEPVQALYLVFLLGFLVVGAYLVVRQVSRPLIFCFCFFLIPLLSAPPKRSKTSPKSPSSSFPPPSPQPPLS